MKSSLDIGIGYHVGATRSGKPNQDAFGYFDEKSLPGRSPIFVVADGMGGHKGGKVASHIVVDSILNYYAEKDRGDPLICLNDGILLAHKNISNQVLKNKELESMGSTVAAAIIDNNKAYITNVGDSRIYLIHQKKISKVNLDHSWVADQVREGFLTEEEANQHPNKNRLTMSVSAHRKEVKPYLREIQFLQEDILIICSDGLWGMVPDNLIRSVSLQLPAQQGAEKLVELANANKGADNITVFIIKGQKGLEQEANESSDETNPRI